MAGEDPIKLAQKLLDLETRRREVADEISDLETEGLTKKQKEKEIASINLKTNKSILKETRSMVHQVDLLLESETELAKLSQEQIDYYKEQKKNLEDLRKATEKQLIKDKEITKELSKRDKQYTSITNALNRINTSLSGITNSIKKVVLGFDEMTASVAKTTATGGKFFHELNRLTEENQKFSVGQAEVGKQFQDLFTDMNEFTKLSKSQRSEIVQSSVVMSKFGVDSKASSRQLDILTKTLGMNVQQATKTQSTFVKFAKTIGVSASRIATEFNQHIGVFARYGKTGVEEFKKLAAQAKATGVSMSGLLGIAGQFDTFEGAAEAAGKLNAILGGGVFNSTELLNASEEDRIKIIKEGIAAQGLQFDAMDKFQKMAVQNALGAQNLEDVQRLLGETTVDEMKDVQKAVSSGGLTTNDLNEQIKNSTSITDQFQTALESFGNGIKDKVIPFLREMLGFVRDFITEHPNVIKAVALIGGGLAILGKTIALTTRTWGSLTTAFNFFAGGATAGGAASALATIGAITFAVAGVGAAAYEAYTNWDLLKESWRYFTEEGSISPILKEWNKFYDIIKEIAKLVDMFLIEKFGKFWELEKKAVSYALNPLSVVKDGLSYVADELDIVAPTVLGGPGYKGSSKQIQDVNNSPSRIQSASQPALQQQSSQSNQSQEPTQSSPSTRQPVILELEGRELGRFILDVIEDKMSLSIPR